MTGKDYSIEEIETRILVSELLSQFYHASRKDKTDKERRVLTSLRNTFAHAEMRFHSDGTVQVWDKEEAVSIIEEVTGRSRNEDAPIKGRLDRTKIHGEARKQDTARFSICLRWVDLYRILHGFKNATKLVWWRDPS